MDITDNMATDQVKQSPQVFLENITFNDGTTIPLEKNSIVVFTGANNCGKSQVLKDIETIMNSSKSYGSIIIKKANLNFIGSIDEPSFFNSHFSLKNGYYYSPGATIGMSKSAILNHWSKHSLSDDLYKLFVNRLSTEIRLTASNALNRNNASSKNNPIFALFKKESLAKLISKYFRQAFNVDLVVNREEFSTISLYVGEAPNDDDFRMSQHDEYYNKINALPKLQDQGDGMRSFASILLDTFTSEHSITLIDEPEAFLHPPQARILGKMLAKEKAPDRQLFIATHSEDFLLGLLDAQVDNVTIIRINRDNDVNHMSTLGDQKIKDLWSNPILRYSNILSGLFHEKVVVCESDYDCLFYQALVNAIFEESGEITPDIMFVHCGGKGRIKDVVAALKAVNVPVCAICDFDLINNSQDFKAIVEAFNLNWQNNIETSMETVYNWINANNTNRNINSLLKTSGKSAMTPKAYSEYTKVEEICMRAGLFIVPVGEMECFDKTIVVQKKEWVYKVLDSYDLATESALEVARKFVMRIVEFKQK